MAYPRHVAAGRSPQVLQRILDDGINLAIWQRAVPVPIRRYLEWLPAELMPEGNFWSDAGTVVPSLFDRWPHLRHSRGGRWLVHDVDRCTQLLLKVRPAPRVKLDFRLGRWSQLGWHDDHTHVRAVVTYRGEGTMWVANRYVKRCTGLRGNQYVSESQSVPDGVPVRSIAAGCVALVTGSQWRDGQVPTLAHRPPPVPDKHRLFLTIDPEPE